MNSRCCIFFTKMLSQLRLLSDYQGEQSSKSREAAATVHLVSMFKTALKVWFIVRLGFVSDDS